MPPATAAFCCSPRPLRDMALLARTAQRELLAPLQRLGTLRRRQPVTQGQSLPYLRWVIRSTDGKYTIVGVFRRVHAPQFPVFHARFGLYLMLGELNGKCDFTIQFMDPSDGQTLAAPSQGRGISHAAGRLRNGPEPARPVSSRARACLRCTCCAMANFCMWTRLRPCRWTTPARAARNPNVTALLQLHQKRTTWPDLTRIQPLKDRRAPRACL